jgi:hypothetical protein
LKKSFFVSDETDALPPSFMHDIFKRSLETLKLGVVAAASAVAEVLIRTEVLSTGL